MDFIDVKSIREKDLVKFINPNKTLVDAQIKKIYNDYLGITINVRQDTYIELKKDQVIELILVCENEAIRCSSVILGSKQTGLEQVIIISIPKLILKIQRREFERIPIVMDIEYSLLPDRELEYKNLSDVDERHFRFFRRTNTIDISAGGVNIVIPKSEMDSKFALINLTLKDENIITLCSKVRTDAMIDFKYSKVVFKYEDIQEQHRQLILDFVSEKSKCSLEGIIKD